MEGIDLTVYRVGLDIECHHLEGIGMHIEGVTLREINGDGTVCTERKTGMFVVLSIVTGEFVLVNGVNKDHITESFADTLFAVVPHAVANHHLTLVVEHRTFHKPRLLVLGVVIALL